MQILTLVWFCLCVFLVLTSLCYGVEVVGVGECADCKDNNIKTSQALSGLSVTVKCKSANGELKRRGVGEFDGNGNLIVSVPDDFVIKEECYAEVHNAKSAAPCPAHDDIFHHTKIVIKSKEGGDHKYTTLGPTHKLKFSSLICTSTFVWPLFNHHPFFPKLHDPHDFTSPPINEVLPPKHPLPPAVPVYEKGPPVRKPFPPPSPVSKPLPPPPCPITHYEPPLFKPFVPPFHKLHPFPPFPKIPGNHFHQPMFGKWPPLPSFTPHA